MTGSGSPALGVALSARGPATAVAKPAVRTADLKFAELGDFLAARRAEVTPEQVGLPGGGSRRLSGLRREEVAMLAGIGASWYAWIEQGRAKNVSPEILAAVAHVLRLDEAQCLYVMRLAGYAAPRRPRVPAEGDQRLNAQIVDGFLPNPAYFVDRYGDIVAANRTAVRLLGIEGPHPNYLEMLFLDPRARTRFPCWERDAAEAVARFRTQSSEFLGDPRLAALTGYLCECSPAFAGLWAQHQISDGSSYEQVLRHPELGQLSLTQVGLDLAVRPGLQLILLSPRADATADRLAVWARESPRAFDVVGVPA
ncbi:helix-turn-helix transcriptional regulator [Streptomyces sp. NPDC085481]|uniref:helix-turn-helix transcriptional regulator n=1 Tax=Streptomyces sp. NPDC085481 TaxID=3365727 RepID=UPI0037D1D5B0